jgi:hypothetical protein
MHRRAARITLVAILLAVGLASAYFLWDIDRRTADLRAADADVSARVARLSDALADIVSAQHAYVTPGQAGAPWFERMASLVRLVYDDTAALHGRLRSSDAEVTLEALTSGIEALVAADTRARENLRLGQPLMAADVIFSDSRNTLDAMIGRLRELRATELRALDTESAALARQRWFVVSATAVVWLVGLVVLISRPSPRVNAETGPATSDSRAADAPVESPRTQPAIDLTAAASLCVDLSRLSTAEALPGLLSRAAVVLDAPGIILWMAAGEELFAVSAQGYPPQIVARLGPIPRRADNATAAAWRDGRATTVPGVPNGNGAIVAPMFGTEAAIGVLAVEVRHGQEQDAAVQAVVTMLAAQLATSVSAWPAASAGDVRSEASA